MLPRHLMTKKSGISLLQSLLLQFGTVFLNTNLPLPTFHNRSVDQYQASERLLEKMINFILKNKSKLCKSNRVEGMEANWFKLCHSTLNKLRRFLSMWRFVFFLHQVT